MNNKVIAIFQIGPVQDFITCARKLQDYWCGSYLLSFLNCHAIHTIEKGGGEIIYPSYSNQKIYQYVKKVINNGFSPPLIEELKPTIPNRFVALLESNNAKSLLEQAENAVNDAFGNLVKSVKDELTKNINNSPDLTVWNEIWQRQTNNFFEVYWSISELKDGYQNSYQKAERLFNARKGIRDFAQSSEMGYKCTLCGERESLNTETGGSLIRQKLKSFWREVKGKTGYRLKENEHLCSICVSKRFIPDYVFKRTCFPSTSTISVASFVYYVITHSTDLNKLIEDFTQKVNGVKKCLPELDYRVEPLPKIKQTAEEKYDDFIYLDGDWFFEEFYENLKGGRPSNLVNQIDDAERALRTLVTESIKIAKTKNEIPVVPLKYYAVFQMDGDDIGKHISQKKSKEEHKQLSKSLCDFSDIIPEIIEKKYLGQVVYFGGDEGVAFVSLSDFLPVIENCYKKFISLNPSITASIGVVIAHHQAALRRVMRELRRITKEVKREIAGKDCFKVAIIKRSGGVTYASAKWRYDSLEVIPLLCELVNYYREGKISDRWWRDLVSEQAGFFEISMGRRLLVIDHINLEITRLLSRHSNPKLINKSQLSKLIGDLKTLLINLAPNWEGFIGLMELASYVARGGGR